MKTPPLPTAAEVHAHAVETGRIGAEDPLPRDLYRSVARELHDAAKAHVTEAAAGMGPATSLSRTTTDLGDRWLIVEVSTAPKENRPHE